MRLVGRCAALVAPILCTAWLLPNHYLPWSSFWQDAVAALGLTILFWEAVSASSATIRLPTTALFIFVAAVFPLAQFLVGQIAYFGDAFIASLYLLGFGIAIAIPTVPTQASRGIMAVVVWSLLWASIASVGLALCQWVGVEGLSMFLVDLPPAGRPFANLAQPNQLATLFLWGLLATLALHQERKVGTPALILTIAWLCFGLAMTQSRTAWIAISVLLAWLLWMQRKVALRLGAPAIAAIACGYGSLVLAWPTICQWLYLSASRSLSDQAHGGVRLGLWMSMIDALTRQPWFGYGWNQTAVAQFRVADAHPATAHWIEDSHNLVLELLIANGLPLGLLIVLGVAWWLVRRIKNCRDADVTLAIGAALVICTHAMLEFPLDYAYFLLPFGLIVGFIETRSSDSKTVVIPRALVIVFGLIGTLLFARVVYEYADIEQRNRNMRFEMAGFGPQVDDPVPVYLLTQLEELPRFARTQAARGMSQAQLVSMRTMAERFGYPPVLFRYALASGLNGDPATASRVLEVLCKVHPVERCREGITVWREMVTGPYPELAAVHLPSVPSAPAPAGNP